VLEEISVSPVWTTGICTNHSGKMKGMISVSSSCKNNDFCEKMRKIPGTVCEKCYAQNQLSYQKTTREKYEKSGLELSTSIISWNSLPVFEGVETVRLESFGELINTVHAMNYINIIRKNPDINFGWWTKRPDLINQAISEMEITFPDNCNVIYSNPYIDQLPKLQKYSFVNGYFTVWSTEEKALEHGCIINCGKRKCKDCLECYDAHDGIFLINELLKK
jgi:hypothetical protein